MNRLDQLIGRRTERRRRAAEACVLQLLRSARELDVEISIVGSLASGAFGVHSDIDLLVHGDTGPGRRAAVERLVAHHLRDAGIPYDLIFASDISAERVQELLHDGLQAPGVRAPVSQA